MPNETLESLEISPDDIEFDPADVSPSTLVPSQNFEQCPQQALDTEVTEDDLKAKDLELINFTLKKISNGWNVAADVDDYCKMTAATLKLLEVRRKTLDMPYRKQPEEPSNPNTGEPL